MNGVMMPVVSAGSNHPGAREMCTAHVSCPAGASERAFVGTISPMSSSTARISAEREIGRSGTRSVMRILLCVEKSFGSEAEDRTNGTRSAADYPRMWHLVNRSSFDAAGGGGASAENKKERAEGGEPGEDAKPHLIATGAVGQDAGDERPANHAEHDHHRGDPGDRAEGRAPEIVSADRRHQWATNPPRQTVEDGERGHRRERRRRGQQEKAGGVRPHAADDDRALAEAVARPATAELADGLHHRHQRDDRGGLLQR